MGPAVCAAGIRRWEFFIKSSENGILLNQEGQPLSTAKDDSWIFVIDLQDNLYLHPDDRYIKDGRYVSRDSKDAKRIGHPSFVNGGSVACAGGIKVRNGKIIYLDNASGHYQPQDRTMYLGITTLRTRGVIDGTCKETIGEFTEVPNI